MTMTEIRNRAALAGITVLAPAPRRLTLTGFDPDIVVGVVRAPFDTPQGLLADLYATCLECAEMETSCHFSMYGFAVDTVFR